jgi:hypothetical protein
LQKERKYYRCSSSYETYLQIRLLIGATVISGGTLTGPALAAIGAGSLIKGAGKWEDSGSWQQGVFTATTEILFGLFGVWLKGAAKEMALSTGTKLVLGVTFGVPKATVEVGVQTYSGKAVGQALGRGGTKVIDPLISEAAKQVLSNEAWSTPVIAVLKYGMKKGADALTTPAKVMTNKPKLTTSDLTDSARPTRDFVAATAFQRWPGRSTPPF